MLNYSFTRIVADLREILSSIVTVHGFPVECWQVQWFRFGIKCVCVCVVKSSVKNGSLTLLASLVCPLVDTTSSELKGK
jgi:hypothetical protein